MFEGLKLQHWKPRFERDNVLVLAFDRAGSSVNTLSASVLEELSGILDRFPLNPPKGLVFISAKSAGFIAGADIKEFADFSARSLTLSAIERGHRVFGKIAALKIPTVAAIHGHCMGGGTELSLACRFRVASNDAKTRIGLPEVKLGIQPGWGGLARLPQLVGAPAAFDMMLTGRTLSASNAKAIGLVDRVVPESELLETALNQLKYRGKRPLKQRLTAWASNSALGRMALSKVLYGQVARKADRKQYPAPFAMIDFWRKNGGNLQQALRAEPRATVKLAETSTARNLVRVYFLQEALKGLAGGAAHEIKHVHVVGAGVMGGDIAAWCALQGFTVSLQDREMKYIQPALDRAQELFKKKLKTDDKVAEVNQRLKADVDSAQVPNADLIIEAIFENLEAKQGLYANLEPRMKAGAILASNTSSIPLDELRAKLARPEQFVGLHYFNPVALMPLVEIVKHDQVSESVLKRMAAFAKGIDKLPVPVASSPGFLVNRVLFPYMLEAATLYAEGVPGPVIDKAAKRFGMPMGPIELMDTVGLDIATSVSKVLCPFLKLDVPKALTDMIGSGKRGKKDGQGFYTWKDGKPVKPEVPAGYQAPEDLEDRMILPYLNECVACLAEGVVESAEHCDAGMIFGTGFAPFRGGPVQHIRDAGKDALKARLEKLASKYGPRFAPKAGWEQV